MWYDLCNLSEWFPNKSGFCQGCVTSPIPFLAVINIIESWHRPHQRIQEWTLFSQYFCQWPLLFFPLSMPICRRRLTGWTTNTKQPGLSISVSPNFKWWTSTPLEVWVLLKGSPRPTLKPTAQQPTAHFPVHSPMAGGPLHSSQPRQFFFHHFKMVPSLCKGGYKMADTINHTLTSRLTFPTFLS